LISVYFKKQSFLITSCFYALLAEGEAHAPSVQAHAPFQNPKGFETVRETVQEALFELLKKTEFF
jgi:hypothetical protein